MAAEQSSAFSLTYTPFSGRIAARFECRHGTACQVHWPYLSTQEFANLCPEEGGVMPLSRHQQLTVMVPAYNEADAIADTIRSLQAQTQPPARILVIDDCSTDSTAEVARACGAEVITPPHNTGSKAGAQNYALQFVDTEYTMAIDANTTLAPDAIEILMAAFDLPDLAAACGFVIPRHVRTIWERGRYIEYLFAFGFYKPIQDYYERPLISSGCFSAYCTARLRENGGWQERTLAEDMDLTWSFYERGYKVRFIPQALCYPIEPHTFGFMRKQLKRWSHGFIQNVQLHWRHLLHIPCLRSMVAVALWDAVVASAVYLMLLPLLAIVLRSPILMLGYVLDVAVVAVPVMFVALPRRETCKALASLPSFFILRTVNAVFLLEALANEVVMHRRFRVYEKGH